MREMLCRAKKLNIGPFDITTSKEWVYGYYVKEISGTEYIFCTHSPRKMVDVDKDTICQRIELTDKNGTGAFEYDIVRDNDGDVYILVWDSDYLGFGIADMKLNIINVSIDTQEFKNCCEIIGNMFDNPELMKGGKENE